MYRVFAKMVKNSGLSLKRWMLQTYEIIMIIRQWQMTKLSECPAIVHNVGLPAKCRQKISCVKVYVNKWPLAISIPLYPKLLLLKYFTPYCGYPFYCVHLYKHTPALITMTFLTGKTNRLFFNLYYYIIIINFSPILQIAPTHLKSSEGVIC